MDINKDLNQIFSNLSFSDIFWNKINKKFENLKKNLIGEIIKELVNLISQKKEVIVKKSIKAENNLYDTFNEEKILKKIVNLSLSFKNTQSPKRKKNHILRKNSKSKKIKKNSELSNLLGSHVKKNRKKKSDKSKNYHKKTKSIFLAKKKKGSIDKNQLLFTNSFFNSKIPKNFKYQKKNSKNSNYSKTRNNSFQNNSFSEEDVYFERKVKVEVQNTKKEKNLFFMPKSINKKSINQEENPKNIPFLIFESNSKKNLT